MLLKIIEPGLIDFDRGLKLQRETFAEVKDSCVPAAIIICRHNPVITSGRSSKDNNIKAAQSELEKSGIAFRKAERGGDVTYHGPGQLMLYPVFNLNYFKKDIHWFLRCLEELVIRSLADMGVNAVRKPGLTGVWAGAGKISSIGIAVRQWVTYYGAALNIKEDDLANFSLIRPCGMDIMMTSAESVLGRKVSFKQAGEIIKRRLKNDQGIFA